MNNLKNLETLEKKESMESVNLEENDINMKLLDLFELDRLDVKGTETKTFCDYCGKELTSDSQYCDACSTKIEGKEKNFKELKDLVNKLIEKEIRGK